MEKGTLLSVSQGEQLWNLFRSLSLWIKSAAKEARVKRESPLDSSGLGDVKAPRHREYLSLKR
jgi:hypothetical protein